ncbi:DUF4440 domain-containing protein [Methylovorus sp. MM2]|uniref:YybH family protein n=1 Tax=Methylovorus sp. MM2 TaxID=1848038 RepID=UPI0007DF7DBE|nr:nuclear transport factor 2 family protein [Methylovorus sp. MM2]OAM52243.1 DUF4440 domain-containing protein [Methylovorus sp. MM2]
MSNQQETTKLISEINTAWDAAFNAGDAALVTSFYDDGATILPSGSPQITGKAEIQAFWQNLFSQGVNGHHIELIEVDADNGLAFQRGKWSAGVTDTAGVRQSFSGSLQLVYRKQADGSLKALSHIWN